MRVNDVSHQAGFQPGIEVLLDTLTDLARKLFNCPVAHLSVSLASGGTYETVMGPHVGAVPPESTLCQDALRENRIVVIEELRADPNFRNHPMAVPKGPGITFFAGIPIVLLSGERVGTLCAMDFAKHQRPPKQILEMFRHLAQGIAAALESNTTPEDDVGEQKSTRTNLADDITAELDRHAERGEMEAISVLASSLLSAGDRARKILEKNGVVSLEANSSPKLEEVEVPIEDIFQAVLMRNWQTTPEAHRGKIGSIQLHVDLYADRKMITDTLVTLFDILREQRARDCRIDMRVRENGDVDLLAVGRVDPAVSLMTNALRGQAVANPDIGVQTAVDLTAAKKAAADHGGEINVTINHGMLNAVLTLPGWRTAGPMKATR